ncbi:MAG: hypothetical protein Q8L48_11915 [Archangium sp.]|nr:hypothetical protein [Archangium sp.]
MNQHSAWRIGVVVAVGLITGCHQEDPPPPIVECPAPQGPTLHKSDVTKDETWTAAGSPHLIEGDVDIVDGATLRIEPCAEVRLGAGSHLRVAFPYTPNRGTLLAEGTEQRPITFKAAGSAPWASLFIHTPGTARLAWATFEGGGSEAFEDNATIHVKGGQLAEPLLFVDHVTIKGSKGTGIGFDGAAAFVAGSQALTITGSGGPENAYPLTISEHALGSVPAGTYTGNLVDEILIDPVGTAVAGEGIVKDLTISDRGVPYHVGRWRGDDLVLGGPRGTLTTVTIEPGVVLKFEPQTALEVQHFTTQEASTASLRALGTAEKPIVFTSAAASPRAGDWRGLWYGGIPAASNLLQHVRIEYAGYSCACVLTTCSAISDWEGAIIFTAQPPGAFISDTTFKDIAGHGVTQGFDGTLVDFRSRNTFVNVSGCEQTRPRNADTTCPDPRPACD